MSKQALGARLHQSAIVSHMMLQIISQIQREYRGKHIGALFEEWLVGWAIYENDDSGSKPMTISAIAKQLNIPRSNVSRGLLPLIRKGIVRKVGRTYPRDFSYVAKRVDADYFKNIRKAIIEAADQLR